MKINRSKDKTILIIEDESEAVRYMSGILVEHGYRILIVQTGLEAVRSVLCNEDISLILIDIDSESGIDCQETVKKILAERDMPVVFLTSHHDNVYNVRIKDITRYGYIIKNSESPIMLSAIEMAYELFASHEKMCENEEKYRLVFDYSPLGLFHFDKNGIITACNDVFVGILGSSREHLIGLDLFTIPDEIMKDAIRTSLNGGIGNYAGIYKSYTGDKSTPVRTKFAPLKTPGGVITGGVGVIEDVTEYKQTLDLLKKINDELEATNEELTATNEEFEAMNEELINANMDLMEKDKALINEKNFIEAMLESLPGYLFVYDEQGRLIKWNKKHEEMTGYTAEELSHMTIDKWFGSEDLKKVAESIEKGYITGHGEVEAQLLIKGGGKLFIHSTGVKLTVEDKTYLVGVGMDITARKKAEDALNESRQLFHLLIESLPQNIYAKDSEGRFVFANRRFCVTMGKSLDEITGKQDYDLHPPELAEKYRMDDRRVIETGKAIELEEEHQSLSGEKFYVQVIKTPFYNSRGETDGTLGIFWDITERRQAGEILAAEKERLSVTLTSIGDGVITTDISGRVEIVNRVAEELTGWSQDEAKGKPVTEIFNIVDEDTRKQIVSPIVKVFDTGKYEENLSHTILISRDGTDRIISQSGSPIKDKNGSITGIVIVFRDITDKRKYEYAVQNAQKLESLGVLAGGIAHDFNNILAGIFGFIDLAKLKSEDSNLNSYLDGAMSAIERAKALTQQLLTFSRGGTPVMKTESLSPFLQKTVQFALSGSNVSCRFRIPDRLPQCFFDKNQIGQVIDNIIINAQQAMPMGGIIEVSASDFHSGEMEHAILHTGHYVKISVKDSGTGIPKEMIPFIFDPFFTTKTQGHGLGLATCYSIINRHGGAIDVESIPGEGSTFHIFIPVSSGDEISSAEKPLIWHHGSGRIIVMDDEDVILNIIQQMLSRFGYSPVVMKNGQDAVNYFIKEKRSGGEFAALIFDLTIPGSMGGIEAIARIREIDPAVPAFVSSGYSEDPVMSNPREFGFTASIRKPFKTIDLSEILEQYIVKKS